MSGRVSHIVAAAAIVVGASVVHADTAGDDPIDPRPWLGISYNPQNGIHVLNVFEGSGALASGLRPGDEIVAVDGIDVMPGTDLADLIGRHRAGEKVTLGVMRRNRLVVLRPVLTPRVSDGEILHRQLVGKPAPPFRLTGIDKAPGIDDSVLDGKVGILVWYDKACHGCAGLANAIAPWVERHRRDAVGVVGLHVKDTDPMATAKVLLSHAPVLLPVAIDTDATPAQSAGAQNGGWARYGIIERIHDRASVVVVDQLGVVRLAAALPANADEAALENVFAAAERQLKSRKPRRP